VLDVHATSTGPGAVGMCYVDTHYVQRDPRWRCRASHQRLDPARSVPGDSMLSAVSLAGGQISVALLDITTGARPEWIALVSATNGPRYICADTELGQDGR
jgi:hypothetical protein